MAKQDDELLTMGRIDRQLLDLPEEARQRVLSWLLDRHGPKGRVVQAMERFTAPLDRGCKAPGFTGE